MRCRIFLVGLVRIYKNITSGPLYPLFGISTHVSAADEEKTRNVKNDLRVVFYLASPLISFGKKRPSGRILVFGFFVRSGDWYPDIEEAKVMGHMGIMWALRASSSSIAYDMSFGIETSSTGWYYRHDARPLRCLVIE